MSKTINTVSPFGLPDTRLVLETIKAGAFAYLHLGRDKKSAQAALDYLKSRTHHQFGVVLSQDLEGLKLPDQVSHLLLSSELATGSYPKRIKRMWEVTSLEAARELLDSGEKHLVLKGNDGPGRVGSDSSFILFQQVAQLVDTNKVSLYIYGGVGVHTAAAYIALGAKGVFLDGQLTLFKETSVPKALQDQLAKFNASGRETIVMADYRVLKWPTMPKLKANQSPVGYFKGYDLSKHLLPLGQDFTLSKDYVAKYGKLATLVSAMKEAIHGHVRQAKYAPALVKSSRLAKELGVTYPIVQGPMARVSDEPEFIKAVADQGALPMLAIGMSSPEETTRLVKETSQQVADKPWGAGLLGFIPPATFDKQAQAIIDSPDKPTAVVIAGGRVPQAKKFEQAGIQAFLHVPSATLLLQYLKEGARRFIFEGRESGGHIGPVHSTVLWEQQLQHLLDVEDAASLTVFFAGGVHDALSSAFVSIMAATLAARGAKIGLVMGTAYLLTKEAVASHAITQNFQDMAIAAQTTVLLESVPGQETRALPSDFVDFFEAEKARINKSDLEPIEKRMALEELNLGRARIATKGVDRVPGKKDLQALSLEDQQKQGLYMSGGITGLINEAMSVVELHERVTENAKRLLSKLADPLHDEVIKKEPIAIIGMAGMFPGADDIDSYWSNILNGVNSVTEVPKSRWNTDIFYDPESTDTDFVNSKYGGFLSPSAFDPVEFGITPASVSSIEPAQLLSLMIAKRALEDAGYAKDIKTGLPDTSVVFGTEAMGELSNAYGARPGIRAMFGELPAEIEGALPKVDEDSFPGILSNVTAGRIANRLNCGGRNFTVDAACASSLAALDVACQELWSERSSMVICGGADLHNGIIDYIMFSATHALSKRGYCATFDESGDGLALGEGVGAIIIKRLSDAERDGDKIYGVIRGIDGSSDGRSLGLTAPNMKGQMTALKRTYEMAGVLPSEVGLVEAHGTGTAVGDRTELAALQKVMVDSGALPSQTWIGSVKTQIGHTKCAAGIAGLIRATLAVKHGVIPPTLHLEKPVRSYVEGESPFAFNAQDKAILWTDERRIAGVSGFGFGGTNFHTIVENYQPETSKTIAATWSKELFVLRGKTKSEAEGLIDQLEQLHATNDSLRLRDVAYSLATSSDEPVQISLVAGSWDELLGKLKTAKQGKNVPGVYYRDQKPGKTALLFSGQGSQRLNMARDLFVLFPQMRDQLAKYPKYQAMLYPKTVFSSDEQQTQKAIIRETENAQPLLGMVDLAIAELLKDFGVHADFVAGHSYGELPALAYAGVINKKDLVTLSEARAKAILKAVPKDKGAMLALDISGEPLEQLLDGLMDVWAVNYNSPTQTIVAGTTKGIENLAKLAKSKGHKAQRLEVAAAFHSPLLKGADDHFKKALAKYQFSDMSLPVWSNTTASIYPDKAQAIKDRLADHLISPVRFTEELAAMHEAGARVFIEAGPGAVLTRLVTQSLPADSLAIRTESEQDMLGSFLGALAQYVASGHDIRFERLFEGRSVQSLEFASPQNYQKPVTTWMVDGLEAVPLKKWQAQGNDHASRYDATTISNMISGEEKTMTTQQQDNTVLNNATPVAPAAQPVQYVQAMPSMQDQLIHAYLQNMRTMMDDQRDIVLATLGYGQQGYAEAQQAIPVQAPLAPVQPVVAPVQTVVQAPAPAAAPAPVQAPAPAAAPAPVQAPAPVAAPASVQAPVQDATPAPVQASVTAEVAAASASAPAASGLPEVTDLSAEELKVVILEVVSEKTGYPVDMLGMEMDLEADLSIDSIKRLEIIGALGEKIHMPEPDESADEEDMTVALEKMAAIKTLKGMVDWLQEIAEGIKSGDAQAKK